MHLAGMAIWELLSQFPSASWQTIDIHIQRIRKCQYCGLKVKRLPTKRHDCKTNSKDLNGSVEGEVIFALYPKLFMDMMATSLNIQETLKERKPVKISINKIASMVAGASVQ